MLTGGRVVQEGLLQSSCEGLQVSKSRQVFKWGSEFWIDHRSNPCSAIGAMRVANPPHDISQHGLAGPALLVWESTSVDLGSAISHSFETDWRALLSTPVLINNCLDAAQQLSLLQFH